MQAAAVARCTERCKAVHLSALRLWLHPPMRMLLFATFSRQRTYFRVRFLCALMAHVQCMAGGLGPHGSPQQPTAHTVLAGTNIGHPPEGSTAKDSSETEATRCILYSGLACILSGDEGATVAVITLLRQAEGVTGEHLQVLRRAALQQRQYSAVWALESLSLEANASPRQSRIHERARSLIEGVGLLVRALNGETSSDQSLRYMVSELFKLLPCVLEVLVCPVPMHGHCLELISRSDVLYKLFGQQHHS